jgi:isocitrate/isopropylmalate dehydrogenase
VTTAARRVLEATGVAFDWDVQRAGATVVETAGTPLPTAVLDSVRATGVAPSANIGDELAVFEPVHGSAPQIAGQDKANPTAAVLSGALLLRHLGEIEAATRVEDGVASVLAAGEALTFDLQPTSPVGTRAMTDAIIAML